MRNPIDIKRAEKQWEKDKAAWTKDSDKPKDPVVRPYDNVEIDPTGASWKD